MDSSLSKVEIKRAAAGHWPEILQSVGGFTAEQLNQRNQPCPKCGGDDRFRFINSETGAVYCNQCFSKKNGDGFAALQWITGKKFSEVLRDVAEFLGINATTTGAADVGYVEAVARAKRMPLDAFKQFGAAPAVRNRRPVARVPVYNERGEAHSYFDLTADAAKGKFPYGKGTSGLFFPGQKPEPGETWLMVEGIKDAAKLVGFGYLAVGLNTNYVDAKYAELFRGVHIVLVHDLDTAGIEGAEYSAAALAGIAASVKIARLRGAIVPSGGADVRDVCQKYGDQAVHDAITQATPWTAPVDDGGDDERPEVELTHDEARVVAKVLPPLGNLGRKLKPRDEHLRTYQRAGELVHVVTDALPVADAKIEMPEGSRRIRGLPACLVRERIAAAVRLYSWVEREGVRVRKAERPPLWLVSAVHERGQYDPAIIPPLTGIITAPTMRPDGSILQRRGYDAPTGLLLELSGDWPTVPDRPTLDDAVRAAGELLEVVADFPFVDAAHRSGWVALVLAMVGRAAIDGPCPLALIDANTRGSGKSLSADAAAMIATGNRLPRKSYPASDEEMRKTITAVALESLPVVLLDNIVGRFGCGSLDGVLTGTAWTDRLLGVNKTTGELPITTIWIATGNNVDLGFDTARRSMLMRMESPLENPEERSGFAHADLLAWVRQERRRLAVAALTMLRAYVVAGRPNQGLDPWGSFEAWSDSVRSAITWAGLRDPADTRIMTRDADRSVELLKLMLNGVIEAGNDATSQDLLRLVQHPVGPDGDDPYPNLRLAVAEICGDKPTTAKLGARMRSMVGRVGGGRRLVKRPARGGVTAWATEVVTAGNGGHGGHRGHVPSGTDFQDEKATHDEHKCRRTHTQEERAETCPPSQPCPPTPPPGCDHHNPDAWVHRDGKAYCPGCDKFLGNLRSADA